MRLEILPLVLGVLLGLIGLALVLDGWVPDNIIVPEERRRRQRRERDRYGEAFVGLGFLAMSAAFIGRDTWRYSILTVILGSVLMLWGIKRNAGYLREIFVRTDRSDPKLAEGSRRIR
jgi:hypothetical protein